MGKRVYVQYGGDIARRKRFDFGYRLGCVMPVALVGFVVAVTVLASVVPVVVVLLLILRTHELTHAVGYEMLVVLVFPARPRSEEGCCGYSY